MFDISKINYSAKTNTNRYSVCWPNMLLLPNMLLVAKIVYFEIVQRSPLLCAPGLVKFTPAVAYLLCLALPGSFLNMFAQNKGDLCSGEWKFLGACLCRVELWEDAYTLVMISSLIKCKFLGVCLCSRVDVYMRRQPESC